MTWHANLFVMDAVNDRLEMIVMDDGSSRMIGMNVVMTTERKQLVAVNALKSSPKKLRKHLLFFRSEDIHDSNSQM